MGTLDTGHSALVTARLTDLGDRTLWRLAVPPLIAVLGTGRSGSLLREVTGQLAALTARWSAVTNPAATVPRGSA